LSLVFARYGYSTAEAISIYPALKIILRLSRSSAER
jgi:hypothetical protein